MKKDIICLSDLDKDDFDALLGRAIELKKMKKEGKSELPYLGKSVGLIFQKPSTRTRISFETAAIQLGATPIFLNSADMQISRSEPVKDTARILSGYIDCLVIRTFSQDMIAEFAEHCSISVVNALSDMYHPCQILSDLMTVVESKGGYENLKIAWVGDGNNVAHSWINAAAVLGLNLSLGCPENYFPDKKVLDDALAKNIGTITVTSDPLEAVKDADVIYTDVWASMGQEDEAEQKLVDFQNYQVNSELLKVAAKDHIVMHCLPAHRGEEITEDVLEGSNSVVWDQAENKMHMHKAVLETLMKD